MTAQNKDQLKAIFETGDTVTQQSCENLIDSYINVAEVSSQNVAGPVTFQSTVTTTTINSSIITVDNITVSADVSANRIFSNQALVSAGSFTTVSANSIFANQASVSAGSFTTVSASTPINVNSGGTGVSTVSAYSVICGGTSNTGPFQAVNTTGTANQVLTSNGAGALPSWQPVEAVIGANGVWITVSNVTVSNDASVEFEDGVGSVDLTSYDEYRIVVKNLVIATDGVNFNMSLSVDGGSNSLSCGWHVQLSTSAVNTYGATNSTGSTDIRITSSQGNAATEDVTVIIELGDINSSVQKMIHWRGAFMDSDSTSRATTTFGIANAPTSSAINSITFAASSGNLTSGNIILQGRNF